MWRNIWKRWYLHTIPFPLNVINSRFVSFLTYLLTNQSDVYYPFKDFELTITFGKEGSECLKFRIESKEDERSYFFHPSVNRKFTCTSNLITRLTIKLIKRKKMPPINLGRRIWERTCSKRNPSEDETPTNSTDAFHLLSTFYRGPPSKRGWITSRATVERI